ncbi:MAG: tyrosine-type recombinase/integrase [Candidatus Bathyarchaeia archaeon]
MVNRWEEYLKVSRWASDYPSVNNLLRHLRYRKIGSEDSRCIYGNAVYVFCKYSGKLPDELLALEKADIEKLIEDFCYHKMDHGWRSPRTANTALFMLKTFFKVNGFKGNQKLEVECFHQSVRERTRAEYIPTLDEARRMANVAGSLRNRAIIFFMLSTGLRNGTIRGLLYVDVKDELEKGAVNILIKVHKGMKRIVNSACKGNIEYSVFVSEEATEALKLYLSHRRRFGEIHNEEVLFCSEHNRLSRNERVKKPLTARELQVIVKTAACKAGIKEWKNVVPHCLRKTFESVLRSQLADGGRLDLKTQEYFMGHILGGSMDTYFDKTKVDQLRKEYAKLMFKPYEQAKVEVLESLQNIAETMGVDYAQLEESKKKELGRPLQDAEKLIIIQEAFKQTARALKTISEAKAKNTFSENGPDEKSSDKQDSTRKTQFTSEEGWTGDPFISPKNPLSESVSTIVSPPQFGKKTFTSPNKNPEDEPIQFSLSMTPQERSIRPKQIHNKRRQSVLESKGNSDLLQFLKHTG